MNEILVGIIAGIATWLIVWGVRWYSAKGGLMDIPNERSSHSRPTPRGGGVGIVVVVLAGILIWGGIQPTLVAYGIASAFIAIVSGIDDVRSLSNRIRFGTHLLAALGVMAAGAVIQEVSLPFIGTFSLGWLGIPLTLFWLVGMTNIYNFMDGIDGIAGSQAAVAGIGWLLFGLLSNNSLLSATGLLIAAASIGFLLHNWAPAKIFMGDVGSAFLGFTFGWLGVVAIQQNPSFTLPALFLLWTFIFDASLTIMRRLQRGENIFAAHRSHLYQRMVIAGQPHARVTLLYTALALLGVGAAWLTWQGVGWLGLLVVLVLAGLLWRITQRIEQKNPKRA